MRIKLVNFRCYENKEYKFPDKGLILLYGATGSGKSTIFEAIFFTLYGKVRKPFGFGKTTCRVELSMFGLNVTRSKGPNRLVVTKNNKRYEDIEAQSIINDMFGFSPDEFLASSYIKQKQNSSVLSLTPNDQIALIEKLSFQGGKHTYYKDKINELLKRKNITLAEVNAKIDITEENLNRMLQKEEDECGDMKYTKDEIKEELENIKSYIDGVNANLTASKKKKEDLLDKIKSTKNEVDKHAKLLEDKRILSGNISYAQTQMELLPAIYNEEKLSLEESRLSELEKEFENRKLYMLGKQLWSEYKTKFEEKMEEYKSKMEEYKQKILTDEELKGINDILKNSHVIKDGEVTPEKAKQEATKIINDIKSIYKVGNAKTIKGLVSYLNKKISVTRKKLLLNEDQLREYRTEATKASITSIKYICPSCNDELMVDNDTLVKFVNRNQKDYEELVAKTITTLCELRRTFERDEKWISTLKTLEKLSNITKYITERKSDELKAKLVIDKTYREMYDKYTNLYEEEVMPESIEKLSSDAMEVKREVLNVHSDNTVSKKRSCEIIKKEIDECAQKLQEHYVNLSLHNTAKKEIDDMKRKMDMLMRKLGGQKSTHSKSFMDSLQEKLVFYDNEINEHYRMINEANEKQAVFKEYESFLKFKDEIDYSKKTIATFKEERKCIEEDIKGAMTLKRTAMDAEIIALQKTIHDINEHSKYYLNLMFDNEPIRVELKSIRYTKNNSKFQLNTQLEYGGNIYDSIDQLSGGERDRVNLAFILGVNSMLGSNILMLDECIASLDKKTNTEILHFLKDISTQKCILVVSHEAVHGVFDELYSI